MAILRRTWVTTAMVMIISAAVFAGEVVLKMGVVDPESSAYAVGARKIAEEVEKATNGQVKIEVYAGGQLGNERDMYEGAQIDSIDICTVVNVVLSSFVPELTVLDQPFLFDSVEQARAAIDGKLGDLVAEKARRQGVHIIGWMESGFRNTFSNKPIKTLDDFRGFKIRTMENKMQIACFNAMGAIATPMAASEQFTALQQGTIDGAENAIVNMYTNRYYEVIKNVTYTDHLYTYIAVGMSNRAWNSVPESVRPAFLEAVKRGVDYQRQYLLDANAEAVEELKKLGVEFHDIDREAIKAVVMPAMEQFKKEMSAEALAALDAALQ